MLGSYKTKYTADSVETNPTHRNTFACATYELDSSTGERHGNITLLTYHSDTDKQQADSRQTADKQQADSRQTSDKQQTDSRQTALTAVSSCETGGILDMWWQDETNLYTANASGHTQQLNIEGGELSLIHSVKITDKILLAVDGMKDVIITSDTGGSVYLLSAGDVVGNIVAHGTQGWGAEVWGLALDKHNSNIVYTGGDDCLLKCHDFRSKTTVFACKHYDMGVCCISPVPPHEIMVGSYDETVVSWDIRSMRQPVQCCKVGGGVWRLKRNVGNQFLLVAGMHSGFHVVDMATFKVLKSYTAHKSLAYGADWLGGGVAATCSFYDNLLSVWDSGIPKDMSQKQ